MIGLTLIYPASEIGSYTLEIGLKVARDLEFLKVIFEDIKVRLACKKSDSISKLCRDFQILICFTEIRFLMKMAITLRFSILLRSFFSKYLYI